MQGPKLFRIPNNEIHDAFTVWARWAVLEKIDDAFRQTFYPILDYAVDGPSSKCSAFLRDCFNRECRVLACLHGSYQRFLVYGLFRYAAFRKRDLVFALHKNVKEGSLCFSLKRDGRKLAVFYLLQATDENSFRDIPENLTDGPGLLTSYIAELTRVCRIYSLYFWRDRVTIRHSHWSRKATGGWRRLAKNQ